ncbi:MAG: Fe-S cluster assembly protein HesB [Ignavibacteria bacterium]|nr:Fe-S cluster assembly protein HesB [Ignavibacteria bacterium]
MDLTARLSFPKNFHLRHTVYSHGWCMLAPFEHEPSPLSLSLPVPLSSGRIAIARVETGDSPSAPAVSVALKGGLRASELQHAADILSGVLNLDLDLAPFYSLVRGYPEYAWMAKKKVGRMLRGATAFEDIVKMILTTNCSWSLTMAMNARLVAEFGRRIDGSHMTFPEAGAIADSSEKFLREEIRLGYRAPFVLEFARRCASGAMDVEALRGAGASTDELYAALRSIKGVGEYAASNLLKLLGRFDRLGLDSWCRAALTELHGNGGEFSDKDIHNYYAPFGEWAGLVMWLDVTKTWYDKKFPLD